MSFSSYRFIEQIGLVRQGALIGWLPSLPQVPAAVTGRTPGPSGEKVRQFDLAGFEENPTDPIGGKTFKSSGAVSGEAIPETVNTDIIGSQMVLTR